jgi:signal transduction histidine kinase
MTAAARRLRLLIDDLLAYSRANASEKKFSLTDLNQVLNEVQEELKEIIEAKHADIHCSPLPTVSVIPLQFQQLVINLVSNALKFSRPGIAPVIQVSARVVDGATISGPQADPGKTYTCISVADNGIGFDPAYSVKIFEIFQRLHNRYQYEGTGVGLAICKKIAENHNGFITAHGEADNGATFNIYLPAEESQ